MGAPNKEGHLHIISHPHITANSTSTAAHLDKEVERNKGDQEVGDALNNLENREYYPVGEPLLVVVLVGTLDGLQGGVEGVYEPNNISTLNT